ncbi:MAG: MAPEG family protein [Candidatus Binatia bacterium]
MDFAALVALLALIEYLVISVMTGRARAAYGVKAPATTGHPMFERWYRVQMNTLEQLVIFLPGLFLFASYVSPRWAGILGLVFVVGRAIYAKSYLADPETRSLGFALSAVPSLLFLLGTLLAVIF